MYSPAQVAKRANTHPNTIRKWESVYAEFLSRPARDEGDARLFTAEDVEVFCTIAALRKSGMPPAEVRERLRKPEQPTVVDVVANAQDAPQALQTAVEAISSTPMVYIALQSRLEAVERRLDNRVNEFVTGIVLGAAIVLVVVAIVLGMV